MATNTGAIYCWGFGNQKGEFGRGTPSDSYDYVRPSSPVLGLDDRRPVLVRSFMNTTCAIMDDGSLRCWGQDSQDPSFQKYSARAVPLKF
jgi:hypothetical protein